MRPQRKPATPIPARLAMAAVLFLAAAPRVRPAPLWEIRVSAPWREFGEIRLKAADTTPGSPGTERFLDGQVQDLGAEIHAYTVDDPLAQIDIAGLDLITYTDLIADETRQDIGDAPGIDLEIRHTLHRRGSWTFGLSASLRHLSLEHSFAGTGSLVSQQYSIHPNAWPSPAPPGGGPDPDIHTAWFRIHDPLQLAAIPPRPRPCPAQPRSRLQRTRHRRLRTLAARPVPPGTRHRPRPRPPPPAPRHHREHHRRSPANRHHPRHRRRRHLRHPRRRRDPLGLQPAPLPRPRRRIRVVRWRPPRRTPPRRSRRHRRQAHPRLPVLIPPKPDVPHPFHGRLNGAWPVPFRWIREADPAPRSGICRESPTAKSVRPGTTRPQRSPG